MKDLKELVRPNIWSLSPYSCARGEFSGTASVFLDANENPYNGPYNRYPDPVQRELKGKIAQLKEVPEECIFLGNGSDEAIDLVFRVFCNPQVDNVVAIEPTYGMYRVAADINAVEYRAVTLDEAYRFSAESLLEAVDEKTKAVFICSPNNPTGNSFPVEEIEKLLNGFQGIVVIDEAYGDFSTQPTFRKRLKEFPQIIVLNTFSKAWASAGVRLGMAFAASDIIELFNRVKYPYNINQLTQEYALDIISNHRYDVEGWVRQILRERTTLMNAFALLPICLKVYPSDANFFLAKMTNATVIYRYLIERGIIVRNRTQVTLCRDCLRITVGSPTENNALLSALRSYKA